MHGPRLFTRTHLLALAALMLLPACSPRKAIPSDPPEVRTEAMVRGAARKAAAEAAQPVAEPKPAEAAAKPDVVVARISEPDAKPAAAAPTPAAEPKAEAAKATAAAPAPAPEAKAEAKTAEAKPAEAKAEPVKDAAQDASKADAKAEPQAAAKAEPQAAAKPEPSAAAQAATAQAAAVPKTPAVQIASFSTEKNAQAALAWLKEKGYSEARVVRVEQGQAVYHRVQAGPFQDPAAARKALEELKVDWPQAFIPAD